MNWGLVPEVFFDVIARLMPGSLFLIGVFAVRFGPTRFAQGMASALPSVNVATLLLFGLLAYCAAIVLKEMWEFGGATIRRTPGGGEPSDLIPGIRSRMPTEVSRLLKLQAEKNACEVLLPGLAILFFGNLWMIAARPREDLTERMALGLVLLICVIAYWRWKKSLERLYLQGLAVLQRLSEEANGAQRNKPVPE